MAQQKHYQAIVAVHSTQRNTRTPAWLLSLRVDSGSGVEYPDQVFSLLFLTSLEPSGRGDFVRSTEHPGKLISFPLLSPLSFNEGLVSPN